MKKTDLSNNINTQTKETQKSITPEMALKMLQKGNERFLNNTSLPRNLNKQVTETASDQFPMAIVLSCIDSRVPAEIVFDQGIGDIFSVRVAGNIVNGDVLGSMEYACKFAGTKLIVVMGHTSCGAVKGACDSVETGNLTHLLNKLKPAVNNTKTAPGESRDSSNDSFVNKVAINNIELTVENILSESPILHEMYKADNIDIAKAIYHVESGRVEFLNESMN